MEQKEEQLEVIDVEGNVLGLATRRECHRDPTLMHRVVHVLVFDRAGHLYLQKRGPHKDIQPGKWDTSVGGHLCPGEQEAEGARRELQEELGISGAVLKELYHYIMWSDVETELVTTFHVIWDGPIRIETAEITEGRFWEVGEIEEHLGTNCFTPNFEDEYRRWKKIRPPQKE
ncbi:NUDIX domain-containing protein [bacterium]|nr:NUDIX domain-containing protein [bacterium]